MLSVRKIFCFIPIDNDLMFFLLASASLKGAETTDPTMSFRLRSTTGTCAHDTAFIVITHSHDITLVDSTPLDDFIVSC